jgi:hypothetical protein
MQLSKNDKTIFSCFERYFLFRKKKFWNAAIASGDRIRSPKK